MGYSLFWDITQRRLAVVTDVSGATFGHETTALPSPMGPIGCRGPSVANYRTALRNIPERRSPIYNESAA